MVCLLSASNLHSLLLTDCLGTVLRQSQNGLTLSVPRAVIGTSTSVHEALQHLLNHGCVDVTHNLNLSESSTHAISGGTFGDVWHGVLHDQTRVAIKCLRLHVSTNEMLKHTKQSAREIYHWSKLKHDNVLGLIGVALFQERLAMISPWMENGTLTAYIEKNPKVNRWGLCLQVAEGLAHIHWMGMVHGDLKPSNILVSKSGVPKISDFGGSIAFNPSLGFGTRSANPGTFRYAAPELLTGDAGPESTDDGMMADVYAFGMTLLEGRVVKAVITGEFPRRPAAIFPDTKLGDKQWQTLVSCWHTDPNDRPMAIDLENQLRRLYTIFTDHVGRGDTAARPSIDEIFILVVDSGCPDITGSLDLSRCSTTIAAYSQESRLWRGALTDRTEVALKSSRLTDLAGVRSDHVKSLAQELLSWSHIKHENVLDMIGVSIFCDELVVVSPWMDNGDLIKYVQRNQKADRWALMSSMSYLALSPNLRFWQCLQATVGLAYIHSIGLVHGNLDGSNILVSDGGTVKIGGFGSSTFKEASLLPFQTRDRGPPPATLWMAPEMMKSMPADVYAIGMIILEVFTGDMPIRDMTNPFNLAWSFIRGVHPQQPRGFSSSTTCEDERWNVLLSCWSIKANCRPKASELRDTLIAHQNEGVITSARIRGGQMNLRVATM
ncbi:kinase-like protein [Ceratobasidium sp. AG-I]|nr:kinase-like protein [Ceratobasidium sp. AG-I]